jgi:hypothetical protein
LRPGLIEQLVQGALRRLVVGDGVVAGHHPLADWCLPADAFSPMRSTMLRIRDANPAPSVGISPSTSRVQHKHSAHDLPCA